MGHRSPHMLAVCFGWVSVFRKNIHLSHRSQQLAYCFYWHPRTQMILWCLVLVSCTSMIDSSSSR
ncbi:hypothetical protein NC651_020664 [Populus alba x Populus x berolinensis]|nr:hypothetical protein NC651_020664 [Populus alba x Populus x berolinensis]